MKTNTAFWVVAIVMAAGAMVMLPGCAREEAAASEAINTFCPIMGLPIDPANVADSLTRNFEGQKVGFCCAGCPEQWDALSDAEKREKLEAARQKAAEPRSGTGHEGHTPPR